MGVPRPMGVPLRYMRVSAHMLRYVTTWHYSIKLSVNKTIIIIEIIIITIIINKNEKYKVMFHLFICLCGVCMVSQQCLVGPF